MSLDDTWLSIFQALPGIGPIRPLAIERLPALAIQYHARVISSICRMSGPTRAFTRGTAKFYPAAAGLVCKALMDYTALPRRLVQRPRNIRGSPALLAARRWHVMRMNHPPGAHQTCRVCRSGHSVRRPMKVQWVRPGLIRFVKRDPIVAKSQTQLGSWANIGWGRMGQHQLLSDPQEDRLAVILT